MDPQNTAVYGCRMDILKVIGANLRRIRGDQTQAQFFERTGIDQSTQSLWESGKKPAALGHLAAKLEEAGIDPLEMLRLEDRPATVDPTTAEIMAGLAELPREVCEEILGLIRVLRSRFSAEQAEAADVLARLRQQDRSLYDGILAGARGLLRNSGTVPSKSGIE